MVIFTGHGRRSLSVAHLGLLFVLSVICENFDTIVTLVYDLLVSQNFSLKPVYIYIYINHLPSEMERFSPKVITFILKLNLILYLNFFKYFPLNVILKLLKFLLWWALMEVLMNKIFFSRILFKGDSPRYVQFHVNDV